MNAEAKTEVSHTPGPWTVQRSLAPHDGEYDFAINADGCPVLSEAFGLSAKGEKAPAEANARLIAAAPDLLSALKFCAARLEMSRQELLILNEANGTRDDVQNETADEGDKNAIEIALAAIAKAEGRAS